MRKRWSALLLAMAVVAGMVTRGEELVGRLPTKRSRRRIKASPWAEMGEVCSIRRIGIRDIGRPRANSCMISPMRATGGAKCRFLP
jgi:hypothetical protein